jgi:dTDP-4-amino-4,6-dideoxygalactose transaminase
MLASEEISHKANITRSHGINNLSNKRNKKDTCPWYYEQTDIGYNYRMSEMQAAMGTVQISRLSHFLGKRNKLANRYKKKLANLPIKCQVVSKGSLSSYHLFTIELKEKRFNRDRLYSFLKDNKIASQVHYIPLYQHPIYDTFGFSDNYCKNAETYFSSCLSIPLHQKLDEDDIDYVVEHIAKFLK